MTIAKRGINNKINWKMNSHYSADKEHGLLYRSEFMGKGIQCEIITPVKRNIGGFKDFGKQKIYFFIDGDDREFKSEEELIDAILESEV
ncbi:MAG: hypothetical protein ACFFG0_41660 [Candidatus Thorarchaeota archaeon]